MNKIKSSPAFSIALTLSLMVFAVSCTGGAPTLNEAVNYPLAPEEIRSSIQRTLDGKEFKISEREGKVLLLNFWATWCLPCIEEMPDLVRLQKELGPKGFEILGMNTQAESPEDDGMTFEELELQVKEIIKTQKLNYEVVWSSSEAYEKTAEIAKMPVVPLSLLIDADGKVVAVFKGGGKETLEKMIDMSRRAVEDHNAKKAEVKN
jgi:thiol-disulfide isomerase/thioredoxin